MIFRDRADAGRQLAQALRKAYPKETAVVYALPRGGVVTAVEIARALHAPLDLIITRKIGHPLAPEYAIAAVAENGDMIGNEQELAAVDAAWLEAEITKQREEARRRREVYCGKRLAPSVQGKTAILVDDGIATGFTMRVAIKELRHRGPKRIIVAVPVAPANTIETIRAEVDDVVVLHVPPGSFGAVGMYYQSFEQVTDQEVVRFLQSFVPASP